jgi:hypothetical protein
VIDRDNGMARALAGTGESRNAYRVLVRKSESKRSRGIFRRRWGDNIKINLKYCCIGFIWLRIETVTY